MTPMSNRPARNFIQRVACSSYHVNIDYVLNVFHIFLAVVVAKLRANHPSYQLKWSIKYTNLSPYETLASSS